jgi:hypothetical protein
LYQFVKKDNEFCSFLRHKQKGTVTKLAQLRRTRLLFHPRRDKAKLLP